MIKFTVNQPEFLSLLRVGQLRGYVTAREFGDLVRSTEGLNLQVFSSWKAALADADVEVVEENDREEFLERFSAITDDEQDSEEDEDYDSDPNDVADTLDELESYAQQLEMSENERWSSDLVRVYMDQISQTPLLTPEEEARAAKKIERTRRRFRRVVFSSPVAVA